MAGLGTVGASSPGFAAGLSGGGTPSEPQPVRTGQLAVFGPGEALTVSALDARRQEARSPNLDVLILGGRPIREPVAWAGPFVMNTREEIMQAIADYHAGKLGSIPAVHAAHAIPSVHGAPTTVQESR
jgi:redox-sensitive bicupin YhaK (pirin superfamily)